LRRIVSERGLEDWSAVADDLRGRCENVLRSGKQCRERWYNHLAPEVNKQAWSYEESLLLFESHRLLGNKWKEISLRLRGR
jgi:hypothetical protein